MDFSKAVVAAVAMILIGAAAGCSGPGDSISGDLVYKIETGEVLAGYGVVDTSLTFENGRQLIRLEQHNIFKARLLGSDLDSETRLTYLMEPIDKKVVGHETSTSSGTNAVEWSFERRDGRVCFTSSLKQDSLVLDLPADVLVENPLFFDFVTEDFVGTDLTEKTYRTLDLPDFEIRDARYVKHAEETLHLAGTEYETVVVDKSVEALGTRARLWIDTATSIVVKVLEQDGNEITLADRSVIGRIARVDLDKYILNKTDVAIADVAGITYMKVRAEIRPTGLKPTPELLNVPGQKFTGTVEDNLIDGVFEIEHIPYDGADAPGFPVPDPDPGLEEFLAADGIYEADDEVLIAEAGRITEGAADSWEAVTRLAAWVSDEINYAIPGGGTARNTYDTRAGECGAHSILLATFCRTLGIPARMVWGCMYTPNQGGSFGQHGWTEVHMGPAGWIPLDATVGETDYVDSGHIRVAPYNSLVSRLNAREFKILDYRVAGGDTGATAPAEERLSLYLGEYRHPRSSQDILVKIMDGNLVVELPDQAMLALDDPDDRGRWKCKLAPHLYVTFEMDDRVGPGSVESCSLHEVHTLPHREGADIGDNDIPAEFAACLGSYHLAVLGSDFTVSWDRDQLFLEHPSFDRAFRLLPSGEDGSWRTQNAPFLLSFVTGDDGQVSSMTLESVTDFTRK